MTFVGAPTIITDVGAPTKDHTGGKGNERKLQEFYSRITRLY